MRGLLRTLAERSLTGTGVTALARRRLADSTSVLAYHNVVPPDEAGRGDASLHIPLPRFIAHLDRLATTHEIVDLRTAASEPSRGRPRAVITFDDAYRGAVTLALPELARRRIPAVVFASPGLLGAESTWWDELGEAGRLSAANRTMALNELRGLGPAVREALLESEPAQWRGRLPASYGIATARELQEHAATGITIGSHAWAHEHLPSLTDSDLEQTLRRSLEWVLELGQAGCPWLALPYGAGSRGLGKRAVDLGYSGVLRIAGGLWLPGDGPAFIPRINVPAGLSHRGLELRTSGLLTRRSHRAE